MKRSNGYRMRFVLLGIVAAIVLGGGNAKADFTFGEPVNLGPGVNSGGSETGPTISPNGLELYFNSDRGGTWNICVATRQTKDDDWNEPVPLGPEINSAFEDDWPLISPDGLELYFSRKPSDGPLDIWVTRRAALCEPWGPAVNLGPPVNSPDHHEYSASITADGLELYFSANRPWSNYDIWVAKRASKDEPWGEPVNLGSTVNTSASECLSCISPDGLVLCFSSHPAHGVRSGGFGGPDIWVTTRSTRDDPWGTPWNPGPPLNTSYADCLPSFSADGRWLYFSDFWWNSPQDVRPGGHGSDDLWKAPIIPIVDFNNDGLVEIGDLLLLIENWGTAERRCDVGPMAWGDGIVDEADLEVLMSYWGQEAYDPTLIAHWRLDETEGMIADDSAANHDGLLHGDPVWLRGAGMVGSALQFDGIDDYVATEHVVDGARFGFVLSPSDGPFSVFAWVKGGGPGQVVLSQMSGVNWLMADPATGALVTELRSGGRFARALCSDAVITEGNWHRVAFTWDGSTRRLCVDDIVVAEDAQEGLASSSGGMLIGCGKDMAAGTFWQGLIDDVRIYNRAVQP